MYEQIIKPAFCDTDALGHINNTKLPIWFEQARNELFHIFTPDLDPQKWQLILAKIEVSYTGELFYGSDVTVRTYVGKIGNASFQVCQQAWQNGKMGAEGIATMVHYSFAGKKSQPLTAHQRAELARLQLNETEAAL